jgi:hypothetical protein
MREMRDREEVETRKIGRNETWTFRASPEGRIGVSIYTGEWCHLGGIIGIPWSGSEAGFGVHVAVIRSFFVVFTAVVPAVGVAAGCVRGAHKAPAVE